jgi:4-amino-4-deoxy-L-arabinose transferase-like glycosyltransferase
MWGDEAAAVSKAGSNKTGIKKWWENLEHRQLSYWLLGGLLWRGLLAAGLPPGFDEAYYYLYTRHLDWSYFDHPLLVALTTGLGPWLFGDVSALSIRLGAVLLYTGSLGLLYLTGRQLFSARAGVLTVAIASIVPIFHLGFGVLTLPDSPLMFFWTAALYVASCEFFPTSGRDRYQPTYRLALLGLCVGLACLGKYHGLALGLGLVGFCLTSRRHRAALRSPWTLGSVGLFLLAISPILVWNVQHDWVSLRFQSGRAIPDRGYSLIDLLVTFLVGTAYLFPSMGLPLWWVSGRSLRQFIPGRRSSSPTWSAIAARAPVAFLLWLSLPLILTFTLMGGYRPILPTWAMPGFWSATLLLGAWAAALKPPILKRWLWGTGLTVASLLLIVLSHVMWGTLQRPSQFAILGGLVPVETDASVQLIDIRQLRRGFAETPALAAALVQTDFLFTNDIYLAGQVGMAIAPLSTKPITCLDTDLRGFAFWSTAASWVGQDGLLVTTTARAQTDRAQFQPYFSALEPVGNLDLQRGGTRVQTLVIYRAHRLLHPYPRPYGKTA